MVLGGVYTYLHKQQGEIDVSMLMFFSSDHSRFVDTATIGENRLEVWIRVTGIPSDIVISVSDSIRTQFSNQVTRQNERIRS